jgi:hypothetical protein
MTRSGRVVHKTSDPFYEDGSFSPRRKIVQQEPKPKPKQEPKPPRQYPPPEFDIMKTGSARIIRKRSLSSDSSS